MACSSNVSFSMSLSTRNCVSKLVGARNAGTLHRCIGRSRTLSQTIPSSQQGKHHPSVLRFEEMTGTWVVFSSYRRHRPHQTVDGSSKIRVTDLPDVIPDCPFCAGNEQLTPNVLYASHSVRVVPNKFPAVSHLDNICQEKQLPHHLHHPESLLLNNEVPAVGFHEVVIESPHHNKHLAFSLDMTKDLLIAFRQRGRAHREFAEVEHTVFFKNHGSTAGASLVHPHSQIVSTPVVPVEAQRLQNFALDYFKQHRSNLYHRTVEEELFLFQSTNSQSRVVDVTDNFLAVVPYASPGPYVLLILPRFNGSGTAADNFVDCSDYTTTTDDLLEECAAILHSCLKRLNILLDEPNFNLVVQTAPVSGRGVQAGFQASAYFRWHIRITPRLGAGAMAGFELGSGFFSNTHMPEDDAMELRAINLH